MNFGKVFKKERERLGVTQKEMAKMLGLTTSALWKIEAGRNVPKESTIVKLCKVAFIPIAYFYKQATTLRDYSFPVSMIHDGTKTMSMDIGTGEDE